MSSDWKIELSPRGRKDINRLDQQVAKRIVTFLEQRVLTESDPRRLEQALSGDRLGNLRRYRVGNFRIVAEIQDKVLTVLVVRIAHRSKVYR